MKRQDDYENRRQHLKDLNDEQLYERFWSLTEQIVKPLVDLSYTHTSPAIERSVLLRMGFSSLEAKPIVEYGIRWDLLGKGIGNVVLTYGKLTNKHYLEAGEELAKGIGWDLIVEKMKGGDK
ncbi:ornithine aminomutase subunit alpha [uncultured Clostridium sp.]|uniref:ornithine aminomutase subunit alpha n=1 Tax=uncultured Clostridium sp. TaxID=59620 RepID=UPI0028E70108|nr:ornithine aminomutase subunit alpha [uncultured Clostridium sp.]